MPISNDEVVKLVARINQNSEQLAPNERAFLSEVEELSLVGTQIPSLNCLRYLSGLKRLNLFGVQVDTLDDPGALTNLQSLDLTRTPVVSLKALSGLTNLQSLYLTDTQVESLEGISDLIRLQTLYLNCTQIRSLERLAVLTNLQTLNLGGTKINSLSELNGLTNLQTLDLSDTYVDSLDALRGLKHLQTLNLSGTKVKSLEALSELTNLRTLSLRKTQVDSLEYLGELKNLQVLDLSDTRFDSLETLRGLTNLRTLSLRKTQVDSLEYLGELKNLQVLDLSDTRVDSLETLRGLTNLQTLNLNKTQINSIEPLASLDKLKRLYVSYTWFDHIPQWLVKKELPFIDDRDWGTDEGVYMKETRLFEQPVRIFSKNREFIEAFYEEKRDSFNEAKVIFLGEGNVGKTYTIKKIENSEEKDPKTEITQRIDITRYPRGDKAAINFWDFGGQEIMHSLHDAFLTERTCYVVVVSNRTSDVMTQARRWLENIKTFTPRSKVLLACNLWQGIEGEEKIPTKKELQREFPDLVDVVVYSAKDSEGIEILKRRIEQEVDSMTGVKMKIPRSWKEILNKIRKALKNYITQDEYRKICTEEGVDDDEIVLWLLDWFNDLGVCFSRHRDKQSDLGLYEYKIFNPKWLTTGLYTIVNGNREEAFHYVNQGRINRSGLYALLNNLKICDADGSEYSKEEVNFVLQIMRKFHLSFDVGNNLEFIPALCPQSAPVELRPENREIRKHIRGKVRYDYLPRSVIQRLTVDCFQKLNYARCWLKGLCVDDREFDGLIAVCNTDSDDADVLRVDVYQVADNARSKPCMLFEWLFNRINCINRELKLDPVFAVCPDNGSDTFISIRDLFDACKPGKPINGLNDLDEIRSLLESTFANPAKIASSLFGISGNECGFCESGRVQDSSASDLKYTNNNVHSADAEDNTNVGERTRSEDDMLNVDVRLPSSALLEQLGQFRNELYKLAELNEDQKEMLSDSLGEVMNALDESEDKQKNWRKRFKTAIKALNVPTKGLNALVSDFKNVADYLELQSVFK